MANAKTKPKKDTPAGYDRWDTFTGSTAGTGKLTDKQKSAIDRVLKIQADVEVP